MSGPATTITRLVFPDQTNHHGTFFGGKALSMMASSAAICATRRARNPVVRANSGSIEFIAPVPSGSIVEANAQIEAVGRTSITVDATLDAEQLLTGLCQRSSSGRFVFVAVDGQGHPPPFSPRPPHGTHQHPIRPAPRNSCCPARPTTKARSSAAN